MTLLRSRGYLAILVVAALLGAPVALASFWFLQLTAHLQAWMFEDLPSALGLGSPTWWPAPVLVVGGLLVALTIRYLPGRGGETPADGFQAGRGVPAPVELAGIAIAALATAGPVAWQLTATTATSSTLAGSNFESGDGNTAATSGNVDWDSASTSSVHCLDSVSMAKLRSPFLAK